MEIHKNGNGMVPVKNHGQVAQLSADGQQWELRIHTVGVFPDGERVLGEVVFRAFQGGPNTVRLMTDAVPQLAKALIVKATSGLDIPNS